MQEPSDQWAKLRRAVLERAKRNMSEPLAVIYPVLLVASALYLAGFLRLSFIGAPSEFTWLTGSFILLVGFCGVLLPFLTGSVLTLRFAERRIENLLLE